MKDNDASDIRFFILLIFWRGIGDRKIDRGK